MIVLMVAEAVLAALTTWFMIRAGRAVANDTLLVGDTAGPVTVLVSEDVTAPHASRTRGITVDRRSRIEGDDALRERRT